MFNSYQLILTCYGTLFATLFCSYFFIIPIYLHTTLYTLPLIILGAHTSLSIPIDIKSNTDQNDNEKDEEFTFLTKRDALLFPVTGSAVLLSLYVLFKYADPWWINAIIKCFVIALSLGSVSEFIINVFAMLNITSKYEYIIHIKFWPFASKEKPIKYTVTSLHIPSLIISTLISTTWFYTDNWLLHNIIAITVTIESIRIMYGSNFNNLTVLLIGLFFYDIFWVFGTPVMVSVATSIKAPVMFIFPISFTPFNHSIIGLGDIVLPGIFISMCLRFDLYLHYTHTHTPIKDKNENINNNKFVDMTSLNLFQQNFKKFYFWVVLFFYHLGIVTTGAIMLFFKHGQPALLYLVPYCLLSFYGSTVLNGEFKNAMDYNDEKYFGLFEKTSKADKAKKEE